MASLYIASRVFEALDDLWLDKNMKPHTLWGIFILSSTSQALQKGIGLCEMALTRNV